ncbi:hypothetical protein N3K66_000739 [Trichothecium roseum]|uniref:Uncharacterized protein n=1 Tax=Trichothecium roseum TaxID=47278 RepID=A0ACC0VCQ7_9HYPO|nr:hypothetical protein N3K66_000739 [Trichothecium roseum]
MREERHPADVACQHPHIEGQQQQQYPLLDMATSSPAPSPAPPPASMLAALNCQGNVHLIVGAGPLASTRCAQSLAAGARPVLLAPATDIQLPSALKARIDAGEVAWEKAAFEDDYLFRLGREEVGGVVDAVFVTLGSRDALSPRISALCRRNRIPVNVVDSPHLCTLSLLSTHTDGPLQIGVTTNGRGCKLASRIRREVAASLPGNLGAACETLGRVRRRVQEFDGCSSSSFLSSHAASAAPAPADLDDSVDQGAQFNKLVREGSDKEEDVKGRRMRWLSQICEYWPLSRLAEVQDADMETLFQAYQAQAASTSASASSQSTPEQQQQQQQKLGTVILAGSGPGHPSLLTVATQAAILSADLVLADKLVPAPVLALVPRRAEVHIARKFPGNADAAQQELLDLALAGLRAGRTVLRLKQGDPYVYGRGAEELDFFAARGLAARVRVLPGVTSALSAPLFAGVPVTKRDVADQVLVCTGTGKKGKPPAPPGYVPTRTTIFLMALHRIEGLVTELTTRLLINDDDDNSSSKPITEAEGARTLHPLDTPCAVVERASCPDQRVMRTTLRHVASAVESEGSRPPGLLVVGAACASELVASGARPWVVEEGFRGLDGIGGGGGHDDDHLVETLRNSNTL